MIGKNEVSNALDGAFRAAFMLTGSTQAAEHAVLDGIAATEFDSVMGDVFLLETVKAAIQRRPDSLHQSQQIPAHLPLELRRLFRIANSPWYNNSDLLGNTESYDRRGASGALRRIGGAAVPRAGNSSGTRSIPLGDRPVHYSPPERHETGK